jgi:hypothetical protein
VYDFVDVGFGNNGNNSIGARTVFKINLLPTTVNFGNVSIRENIPQSPIRTWPNGDKSYKPATLKEIPARGNCEAFDSDLIGDGPIPIDRLWNGTSYVDFSFTLNWEDEYLNASSNWVGFASMAATAQFRGSDQACQETYQSVPGSWQGPWQQTTY